MTTPTKEQRKASKELSEMYKTYNSAEWLLKGRIDDLSYLLFKIYQECNAMGVSREFFFEYMDERVMKLLDDSLNRRIERSKRGYKDGTGV